MGTAVMERDYLLDQYAEQLSQLERAIGADGDSAGRYHRLLKDVDEDLFFYLAKRACTLPPNLSALIPSWPPEDVRTQSTSDIPFMMSMLEALTFWNAVKRNALARQGRDIASVRVADYGAGWGRIARFSGREVPEENFLSFEPNPEFVSYYKACGIPGRVVHTDWGSSQSLTEHGAFDVIYCFSILTHTSDALTQRVRDRWIEITTPGSLVLATIRPRFFLEGGKGDAEHFADAETSDLMRQYDRDELIYRPYPDAGGDWGVTVMSPAYVHRVFGGAFNVIGYNPIPTTPNQMIMILQRK
jgi:hypothetical protein